MNEQEQHTPGPWSLTAGEGAEGIDFRIHAAGGAATGLHIAEVFQYQNDDNTNGPAEANAHLIAAAPEMLKALRRIGAERCYCEYHYAAEYECAHEVALVFLVLTRQELLAQAQEAGQ